MTTKALTLVVAACVTSIAQACPACASGQSGGPRWLHLVMVLLPFVVVAAASRAIWVVLRESGSR